VTMHTKSKTMNGELFTQSFFLIKYWKQNKNNEHKREQRTMHVMTKTILYHCSPATENWVTPLSCCGNLQMCYVVHEGTTQLPFVCGLFTWCVINCIASNDSVIMGNKKTRKNMAEAINYFNLLSQNAFCLFI